MVKKKGCRANLFLKGTERFPHVIRAFIGYNAPNPRVLGVSSGCFQKVSWVGNRASCLIGSRGPKIHFGLNDSRRPKIQELQGSRDRGLPPLYPTPLVALT